MIPPNHYRFTLSSTLQGSLVIVDPIGWEDLTWEAKRDSNTHGVFFDISGTTFKFWGNGYDYLMTAFDDGGIEADVTLLIEETCDSGATFSDFFSGQIDFTKKEQEIGTPCLFIASVVQDGCLVKLKNKLDEKVVITTTNNIAIPTKTVLKYASIEQEGADEPNSDFTTFPTDLIGPTNSHKKSIVLFYGNKTNQDDPISLNSGVTFQDAGNCTSIGAGCNSDTLAVNSDTIPTFVAPETGNYTFKWDIDAILSAQAQLSGDPSTRGATCTSPDGFKGGFKNFNTILAYQVRGGAGPGGRVLLDSSTNVGCYNRDEWHDIEQSNDNSAGFTLPLIVGDKFFLYFEIVNGGEYTADIATINLFHKVEIMDGSYFNVVLDDSVNFPPTGADVVFIDEAFQTALQKITDNCIGIKSLFFGHTDGVIPEDEDGCAGLNVLTNGLKLRNVPDKSDLFLSVKFMYENLSAIYNLGMGVEIIGGDYFLRIESVKYFYDDTVMIYFDNIPNIKISFDNSLANNKLSVGYSKWESEGGSGLDDIMTKRIYHNSLTTVKGELSNYSDIIASNYSVEVTRRIKQGTKDFKYDNDIFIFCLNRTGGGFEVTQGNVDDVANIIDASNDYNFAITPARNAFRWFKTACVAVKDYLTAPLRFTYGEGNYIAQTFLTSGCTIEANEVIENEDITYSDLTFGGGDLVNHPGIPLYTGDVIEFEAPLSQAQVDIIQATPNFRIGVSSTTTDYNFGYIKLINYKKKEKIAKFELLKSIQQ